MKRRRVVEALTAYLLLLPGLLVLVTFQYLPAVDVFRLSLTNRLLLRPFSDFIGFDNYLRLLSDGRFWNSVWNTLYYVGVSVPLEICLALLIAMALARKMRGIGFFRTGFFLPVVTSMVSVSIVWEWIFHPSVGILNAVLGVFGFAAVDWLNNTVWAMPALILITVWKGTGYYMVIYLAGLLDIPDQYYEAARIDGGGRWRIFRDITWPLLMPTTYLILILEIINSFQVFATIYVLTGGGPSRATEMVVFYLYERAFQSLEFGYASAISVVLFVFLVLLTVVQRVTIGQRISYDR